MQHSKYCSAAKIQAEIQTLLLIFHPLSVPQSAILLGRSPKSNFSCFVYNESANESYFDINSTF